MERALIAAISEARKRLPAATWDQIVKAVRTESGEMSETGINRVLQGVGNADVRRILAEAFVANAGQGWSIARAIFETASYWANQSQPSFEMIWTGPGSHSLAARRIDQILYDLLAGARREVFLITFSAYRVARLSDALGAAHARGVKITLLLETATDSDGQLSDDALNAFSALQLNHFELLHWPREHRSVNAAGRPGKLHAKCAVVDDAVVISSANLTDDAFTRNMEMGVVVDDLRLAAQIRRHFEELQRSGIICPLKI